MRLAAGSLMTEAQARFDQVDSAERLARDPYDWRTDPSYHWAEHPDGKGYHTIHKPQMSIYEMAKLIREGKL